MRAIRLFLENQSHACSYLPGRRARYAYVAPDVQLSPMLYSELVALGFRRTGQWVYRPECDGCQACVPVRIPVTHFHPNRIQRRVERRNRDLTVRIRPVSFSETAYRLYRRYVTARHGDGGMADTGPEEFIAFLDGLWADTVFAEFWLGMELIAVAVIDRLPDSWSAVYSFYDPDLPARSLGSLVILWQIAEAKRLGLSWLYLGYWISECRKMVYKNQYRPLEAYVGGSWRCFEKGENITHRCATIPAFDAFCV